LQNLRIFLPQIATYQLEDLGLISLQDQSLEVNKLTEDWQTSFCQFVGLQANDLPWTQLRLAQFELPKSIKVACCCDPVLMKMTHRGAYMLGQAQLELSQNDAIRIVAQINERLMGEGEQLFLIDNHAWLFTSEQALALESKPFKDLVGTDIFKFSYLGKDAKFWHHLGNEIQMLIKEMSDYQGLAMTSPETIMNVHFFDLVNLSEHNELPFIKNENLEIISDNELIKAFCLNSFLAHRSIVESEKASRNEQLVIAFDSEREHYTRIIELWKRHSEQSNLNSSVLYCLDSQITYKPKKGFIRRLLNR